MFCSKRFGYLLCDSITRRNLALNFIVFLLFLDQYSSQESHRISVSAVTAKPYAATFASTEQKSEVLRKVKFIKRKFRSVTYETTFLPAETSWFQPALPSILLIPPIGVGISNKFFDRLVVSWSNNKIPAPLYAIDLIGCGTSNPLPNPTDPRLSVEDWSAQLIDFVEKEIDGPVVVVGQGGSGPLALQVCQDLLQSPNFSLLKGLVLLSPPSPSSLQKDSNAVVSNLLYQLSLTFLGTRFYEYASTRDFLKDFSEKFLFLNPNDVTSEWLDMCEEDGANQSKRFGVFSFLTGSLQKNYSKAFKLLGGFPTLIVVGEGNKFGDKKSPENKLIQYAAVVKDCKTDTIPCGQAILPWECPEELAKCILKFLKELK